MPIDMDRFEGGNDPDKPYRISKKLFELLKNNQDKAYSTLDFQNELNAPYNLISAAIRLLKKNNGVNLRYRWLSTAQHNRMLYYAYKENVEVNENG